MQQGKPTTMDELRKLLADCKDSAQVEILEVARAQYNPGLVLQYEWGWAHAACLLIRIGPLDFTATVLCEAEGRYWHCLWCSDPDLVELLKSDPKADGDPDLGPDERGYAMGPVFNEIVYPKLPLAVKEFEKQRMAIARSGGDVRKTVQ